MIKSNKGQVLVIAILFLSVSVLLVTVMVSFFFGNDYTVQKRYHQKIAFNLAEAGLDKAINELNSNPSFNGETVSLGNGEFITDIDSISNNLKLIKSTGYYPDSSNPTTTKEVRVQVEISTSEASFFYGVQVGIGGLKLANGASIEGAGASKGNVYSMGSVVASQNQNQTEITGDAILAPSPSIAGAGTDPSVDPLNLLDIGSASATRYLAQSFIPATTEKIHSINLKIAKHNSPTTNLSLYIYSDNADNPGSNLSGSGQQINANIPDDLPEGWEDGWTTQSFSPSINPILQSGVKYWLLLVVSGSNSNNYWHIVRSADDNAYLNNTARLDSDTAAMPLACVGGCDIAFQTSMGSITPTLKIGTIGGNATSHTINGGDITGIASYDDLLGTVKAHNATEVCAEGSNTAWCKDGSPDSPAVPFPISSAQITQMEAGAAMYGTEAVNCNINGGSIGPKKYDCDVNISGTVTLEGTIWVDGNFRLQENATLKLAAGYGDASGTVIADYHDDPTTKGKVIFDSGTDLQGNGNADTYVMIVSMYRDPSNLTDAIYAKNNLSAGIFYAPEGQVTLENNVSLREVTAQSLNLMEGASITYETGLASLVFSNGPGATWLVKSGTWQEL